METFVLNIVKFQLILEFNSYFTVQVFLKLTVRWKGSECYGDYMYRVRYLSNIRRQTQVSFIPRHQTLDTIQTTCLQSDICLILGDKPRLVFTLIIDTRHYIDYMFTVRYLSDIRRQTQVSFYLDNRHQTLYRLYVYSQIFV